MTPREPYRFETWKVLCYTVPDYRKNATEELNTLIRAAESSALEQAAQIADRYESGVAILIADGIRAMKEPAAAPAADLVTCSTDTDEHHAAHRLRPPTRTEKSWCEDPVPAPAPAAECTDHWHCDPAAAAHACKANRSAPCPTCRAAAETGKAPGAEARDLFAARLATQLVYARARVAEVEAALLEARDQLCAEHCEWTGSGEHDDQCVKLSKVLAASVAPPEGEGT